MKLTPLVAGNIRTNYASGLYHKADLALNFISYLDSPLDISKVLDYTLLPEVRTDLKDTIKAIELLLRVTREYHDAINEIAQEDYTACLTMEKSDATFKGRKEVIDNITKQTIKNVNEEYNTNFTLLDIASRFYRDF